MAISGKLYGNILVAALNEEIDWMADTIKVALCTGSYVPSQANHNNFDDVTNEISGTGYTAGGETLTGKSISYSDADKAVLLGADDVMWSSASFTARYGVIYQDTGTPATSLLIGYVDFGQTKSTLGGNFAILWNSSGMLKLNV